MEYGLELTDCQVSEISCYVKQRFDVQVCSENNPIVVSIGRYAYRIGYKPDIYINISEADKISFFCDFPSYLIGLAIKVKEKSGGRVGAALLTEEGSIYKSCEVHSPKRKVDYTPLHEMYPEIVGLDLIDDFIDTSTSVHAESNVIFDAIRNGESPKYLATTRIPCISCCRLIRQSKIVKVSYLSYRNEGIPSNYFLEHIDQSLGDVEIFPFSGIVSDDR